MKKCIGLFILVIFLAAISGCTQPAKPVAAVTAEPTAVITTDIPTAEVTIVITPIVVTTAVPTTTAQPVATNMTMVPTAKPVMTPSTKLTTIHIRNNTYIPSELTVLPGTGITWINDDAVVHTIKTTGDHAGMFTSSDMVSGGQYHYTFGENEGTFVFTDKYFPAMQGTITVKNGALFYGAPLMQNSTSS